MHSRYALRSVVALLGVTLAVAGCGRYSFANLKAKKSFNEANVFYAKSEFGRAAEKYEQVVANPKVVENDPLVGGAAYFYLANSYENLYKPGRKGQPENDANLKKAEANYLQAAEKASDPLIRRRAIEYLVALYAPANDKLNAPDKSEALVHRLIEMDPNDPANYHVLGKVYQDAGRMEDAENAYKKAVELRPTNPESHQILAGFYNSQGDFEKTMQAMQARAANDERNPEAFHQMATWYWEKVQKDYTISRAKKQEYVSAGLAAEEKALAINPDYFEALTYKGLLLRQQETLETNPARKAALVREAEQLLNRAMALQKKGKSGN